MSRLTSTLHCSATPTLTAFDTRANAVRQIQYNLSSVGQPADVLVTHMIYTAQNHMRSVADPRFFDPGHPQGSATPNFQYCRSLSGQILSSDSLDAGREASLPGADARPRCAVSNSNSKSKSNGNDTIVTRYTYDSLGRLTRVSETTSAIRRISERIIYGQTREDAGANLRGLPVSHLDTAGLLQTHAYSLSSRPLTVARRLLAGVETDSDWIYDSVDQSFPGLSDLDYRTRWRLSAAGEIIAREDAKANVQSLAYDLRGRLRAVRLRLAGETDDRTLVTERTYAASGQIFDETLGNGILTQYRYEPDTQRPQQVRSIRPARAQRAALLRDLRYAHDPVGNVISIEDRAQPTDHFANQRTQPVQRYRYDALYQLTEATGRENANRGAHGLSSKATAATTLPRGAAAGQLDSYTRRFGYDLGGNLTHIAHQGATVQYTKHVVVAATSNRAVAQDAPDAPDASTGLTTAQVNDRFDARGNLLQAGLGLALRWDARNQLREAIILSRPNALGDRETYSYDSGHLRVTKVTHRYGAVEQRDTVIYLPGLELRTREIAGQTEEATQVVLVDDAGGSRVRMLHWDSGQPAGIGNDQLRISLNDQIGSSLIELDERADIVSEEAYYPYGGTALQSSRSAIEAKLKYVRHAGKERDATGFYYYGWRYYLPCCGRWASADPDGPADGLNLFRMTWNNPIAFTDDSGLGTKKGYLYIPFAEASIYKMAVGYNIVRSLNNKDPYEIISENKATLNGYRAHLGVYIKDEKSKKTNGRAPKDLREKWAPALKRLESPHLAESYFADLSHLDAETSKIYILGHGNAGISSIASDPKKQFIGGKWQSIREVLEADELAQRFSHKKLPAAFSDFRLVACQGANAITATDLSNNVPAQMNGKIALGQRFADSLSAAGFTEPIVTAYRGYGKIAAPELRADLFDHQKRSVDMAGGAMTAASLRRNMEVRQSFKPGR